MTPLYSTKCYSTIYFKPCQTYLVDWLVVTLTSSGRAEQAFKNKTPTVHETIYNDQFMKMPFIAFFFTFSVIDDG